MTPRDRVGDPPGRREAAGDVGHRQGFQTPSGGSPRRPERRLPKAFGRRRARHAMSRIATPRAPRRKPWEAVSMGHYQCSLVSGREKRLHPGEKRLGLLGVDPVTGPGDGVDFGRREQRADVRMVLSQQIVRGRPRQE